MKKIYIALFTYISVTFASQIDVVELYRTQGLKAVEQLIEQELKQKSYWEKALEKKDLSNGYYESIKYLMICQKNLKDISLYDTRKKQKVFSSTVFTGEIDGDKKIEGDLKTPVGVYELKRRITSLAPLYGALALTTSYPNHYDKVQGKTGHGIWIHGMPEDEKRDEFTQGCIALENDKITKLDEKIDIKNSILVISEQEFLKVSKEDIAIVLSNIFQWKDAWKYSDLDRYLSFYSDDFKRVNGQDLEKFKNYKKRIFNRKQKKTIIFSDINIIPYPNDEDKKIFKVKMKELYKTRTYRFDGIKELYVEIDNGEFKILTES